MYRGDVTVGTPTFSVEVITLPVRDVDRALRFYVDQVGFTLDVDSSWTTSFVTSTSQIAVAPFL